MVKYGIIVVFLVLIIMVRCRIVIMKHHGYKAFVFAKTHRSDWLLPPVVAFFIYHLFADIFGWPHLQTPILFNAVWISWLGLLCCFMGLGLFGWGIYSFGTSFRIGIDEENPDKLITAGAFGISRNPLYVAFAIELIGFFMIIPNLLCLIGMLGGFCLFHRQILREEAFLKTHYGKEYEIYCQKVRRYL